MEIVIEPSAAGRNGWRILPDTPAYRTALWAITEWHKPHDLLIFLQQGRAYGNSDSMTGINYPQDLDAYDLANGEEPIPEGMIAVYGDFSTEPQKEYRITEEEYVRILRAYFLAIGREDLAQIIPED